MNRKVGIVITARPSYSRIKTVLSALKKRTDCILEIYLAGSANSEMYGSVSSVIKSEGFEVTEYISHQLSGSTGLEMASTTGLGIIGLASLFSRRSPDVVITIADRYETIATSIAASYQNIPLAHVQGGEVTGNIDEKVRHANTKLADIHLVASKSAALRVEKMGEEPGSIHVTGCPSLDLALPVRDWSGDLESVINKYGGVGPKYDPSRKHLVVLMHPVTSDRTEGLSSIRFIADAIKDLDANIFWFWPNVDAGSDIVSKELRNRRETGSLKNVHFFRNFEPLDFLKLIKTSACLIGNSSAGIREAGFLGVPVVNIGSRQAGRERGPNVLDVDVNLSAIQEAIKFQMEKEKYPFANTYGDGRAGDKIAEILATSILCSNKKLVY